MSLPEETPDTYQDDYLTANLDITDLVNKFIVPIERLRSISAPSIFSRSMGTDSDEDTRSTLDSAQINPSEPQESRCHAFLRMIGFPVVSRDNTFYNPGFNHKRSKTATEHNAAVDSNMTQDANLMAQLRENSARNRYTIFKKHGLENSVYSLVLPIIKPFNVMANAEWDLQDNQSFTIAGRKSFVSSFRTAEGNEITNAYETGTHILRPFTVHPVISKTVMPATRIVCEPFLETVEDTKLTDDKTLLRPGIELILRLRLEEKFNSETNSDRNNQVEESPSILSSIDSMLARNLNEVELKNTEELIKELKFLIHHLIRCIHTVYNTTRKIYWTPIASPGGPEFGTDIGNYIKYNTITSELEAQIRGLETLKKVKEVLPSIDNTSFAIPVVEETKRTYDEELQELKDKKNEFSREASDSLRDIEYIIGEVSGLGLVDILTVNIALWSVDVDVLLSMLDNTAFNRLYAYNPGLRTSEVEARMESGPKYDIHEAIKIYDGVVSNILSFVDRILFMGYTNAIKDSGSI